MKREIKRPSSIVLALVLMFVTVLNSIPVTSKASGTGTYNEKTFADIGMDGDIENAAFNTNLTTWDKVALTGKVTFGEAEWDTVLVIGGIGTQDWLGIQLVPMNDGFYIASSMCDSTGTIGYTMKVGDSTDLLISNDAFGGESLLGQTVKLRLTFDYIETGIKMGITINDNHIQDVILGASVEDETVTAKDVIGSYVLGYNISVSSEKKENEPIEYTEKTFADIGMDGAIANSVFNTNLTTWDKVALTGEVTFGETEWDTVLIIGGIGTEDWYGINLVPMNDGLYITSPMCDSTGTTGYTINIGDSTELLIANDAIEGESLLGKTVKLRLTFDYIETGIKMGITINDNHIQDVILGASVEDETVTAKDVIGSYVLGYNISVSSEKKENEPIEYTEKTFADIGMDGTIANSVFNTNLTTWDKVALTGEVTFGSAEWDTVLVIGGIGTEDWYGINIVPMNDGLYINSTMCDSTGTTGYTITIGDSTELLIGNDAFGGKSLLGKTAKMRLTFEYTETGIKMGITINDNFIQDVNLGASVEDDQVSAKDVIGSYVLGYNISVASKKTDGDDNKPGDSGQGEPVEYTELTFDDIGMQGFISSSVYNTKLSTWDKVALIGELTFGEVEWDTALVIGGIGTQDWIGIQIVPMNDGLYIVGPMSDTNGTGYTITIDDGTELLIKNDVIGGESLLGKTVKLRLTFEYTDTGIKMGVTINDKFVQDVNFGKALEDNSVNAKDIIGTYVLGYNITLLSKGTEEDENNQTPEELGYKEITINSFSLPYNATYAPGQNEENHRVATYVGSSLDMTYLNTDITFGAEQGEQYINYASADGWRGINIRVKGGALHFSNADTGTGVAYTAEELGLTSLMETFNLKLAVDMGTFSKCNHWSGEILPQCDEIKVCIWINDKMIAKDIVFNDVVMAGNGIGIYTLDHKITLGTPIAARVGIDFSLFGYTKQWKNEIKAK